MTLLNAGVPWAKVAKAFGARPHFRERDLNKDVCTVVPRNIQDINAQRQKTVDILVSIVSRLATKSKTALKFLTRTCVGASFWPAA